MSIVRRLFSFTARVGAPAPGMALAATLLIAAVAGLVAAPSAQAQQFDVVTFDLTSESSVSLLGGTLEVPRDGTLTVGTLKLLIPSTATGVPTPGSSVLLTDFSLAGNLSRDVQGQALVSGTFEADQTADLTGVLSAGLDVIDFQGSTFSVQQDVNLGCTGTGCASLGLPVNELGMAFFGAELLAALDLDQIGQARLEATVPIELGGVLGTFNLVALESSRIFVPEPGTALLMASGLALMARRGRGKRSA